MEQKFWWRGQSMGGVFFVKVFLFWELCTHRSRWLSIHLCLLAQCHPKGSNWTGNLWFQMLYTHSRTAMFDLKSFSEKQVRRRRSQEKGFTHLLPKFTASFLLLRSGEEEVLQLVFKTQMFFVKSWSSSSSTTLKSAFPYAAHFPSLFISRSLRVGLRMSSWL